MVQAGKIKKVRDQARKFYGGEDWKHHVLKVAFYARQLGKKYKADMLVVELAAYLHDIARSKEAQDREDHHLVGAQMARQILFDNKYPAAVIDQVVHCIEAHRYKEDFRPRTIEAKIIANADAISHFDIMPLFYFWRSKKQPVDDITTWIKAKLNKDWDKKLTLPGSKQMVRKKYDAIKLLLKNL